MFHDLRRLPWRLRYIHGSRVATEARRALIRATHSHANIQIGRPVRLGPGFELDVPASGTFTVGSGVDFRRGFKCEISGDGRVVIGPGTVFTSYALIQCSTLIEILPRSQIGQSVLIVDGNHRFRDWTKHMFAQGYDYKPITIGPAAIIYGNSTVVASVGKRSVIGANSVVTRDVPAYCLAAGAPARIIEYFGPPELRPPELDE